MALFTRLTTEIKRAVQPQQPLDERPPTPALGHTPYIKADYSMCCPAHEETAFRPATEVRWIALR